MNKKKEKEYVIGYIKQYKDEHGTQWMNKLVRFIDVCNDYILFFKLIFVFMEVYIYMYIVGK